jgi:predicted ferric reductase
MNRYIGALAWFGLYAGLVVLPAGVAAALDPFAAPRPGILELSVAVGLFAYPLILIQFALVSRLQASSRPFGTDALVQFHQYMGFLSLAFVLVHPLLLNAEGLPLAAWSPFSGTRTTRSGAFATLAILLLVLTTVFRRRLGLSYEWWQRLHLALGVSAAAAMLVHVLAAGGYAQAPALRNLLVLYAAVFGSTAVHYRLVRPWRMARRPWTLTANRDEGGQTRTLTVRPDGHAGVAFEPGQFAWLVTGRSPWSPQQHPLSLSSSAERGADGAIEFSVRALGDWSGGVVPALAPGTRVWVDAPFGAFTTERLAVQGFVFIAGGIGIAPVRSMLLTMRDRGDRRHTLLVYAAPDESRLVYRSELEALREVLNLDIVYVVEKPAGAPAHGVEHGQVTPDLLRRHLPRHFARYGFLLCGPPPMMDAVADMLTALGVPRRAIETEQFNVV